MSGRPTTRRSTRWCRLLLVMTIVSVIALPSLGRIGAGLGPDTGTVASATTSASLDDAAAVASVVRAERTLFAVLAVIASVGWMPAPRIRRIRRSRGLVRSRTVALGGVGLRAPPGHIPA